MTRFIKPAGLLLLFFSHSLVAGEIVRDYPLDKISDRVYIIHGPLETPNVENQGFMNNPAIVETSDSIVIVDPGSSLQAGRMLMKQLKSISDKPVSHVLNTHIHGDHWLGNQAVAEKYPEVQILAHPAMIAKAKAGEAEVWVKLMHRLTEGFTDGTLALIPAVAVNDGDSLEVGGVEFRFYAPENAHSRTDMMIEVVDESVMFLGDNVLYQRIARMDDGSFIGSIAACDIALEVGSKLYVPGHGPSGGKTVVESYRNYLDILYNEVAAYYEDDLSDFEMKPKIRPSLSAYHSWAGFESEFGRHISLAILEVEQNSF